VGGGEVRLVGLEKRFEDVTAVDGIDLDVPGGEFFALLGPSGCGKTTTLRLVAGFEQPTAGRILLDGVDMARTPPHKRKVNTVFQSYALFPFLDVADNVAFGLRFQDVGKAEARRRVGEALAPAQLYEEPATTYVAGFLGVANLFPAVSNPVPNGGRRCRLRLGEFELEAAGCDTSSSGAVQVVIRRERVRLEPYGSTGPNRVPGMVERLVYQGPATQLVAAWPTARPSRPWSRTRASPCPGSRARPSPSTCPDALRVLPERPDAATRPLSRPGRCAGRPG
jgi:ABC-type Fe3+/spermidine/putrescine transport system ATPase subunit